MPSPFPGMDPYLERPDIWAEIHNPLMVYARDALQPLLPPHYVARLELRIYTDREARRLDASYRIPDLELVRTGPGTAPATGEEVPSGLLGYWFETVPREQREAYVTIRTVPEGELVTAIELLSPTNKLPGKGREEYISKQAQFIDAGLNLVEIDLIRGGSHTVAIEREALADVPPFDYLACIHRSLRPWCYQVIPWSVHEPMPPIPVPLAPGDGELPLALQELMGRAYDNAAAARLVDYNGDPEPSLSPEKAAWAHELLRKAGLRRGENGA